MGRWSIATFTAYAALSLLLAAAVLCEDWDVYVDLATVRNTVPNNPFRCAIIVNATLVVILSAPKLLQLCLLGPLRLSDKMRISSELWSCAVQTVLLATVFRSEISPVFVLVFGSILLLRPLHWVCQERSSKLGQSSSPKQGRFCFATCSLLLMDAIIASIVYRQNVTPLLFLTEISVMMIDLLHSLSTFFLSISSSDSADGSPSTSQHFIPQLALQMIFDSARLAVHIPFIALTVQAYALSIHTIKDIYVESKNVSISWSGITKAREAKRWLEEDLAPLNFGGDLIKGDQTTCLVCREDMICGGVDARVLPCCHAFHLGCLKVWIERQQSCPTCRTKVRPLLARINAISRPSRFRRSATKRKPSLPSSPIST